MQRTWLYERGQGWSHPSLLFLHMAMMVWVLQDPTPGKWEISCTSLPPSLLFEVCHWHHRLAVSLQDPPHPPFFYHLNLPPVPSFWGSWTHITVIHATHSSPCPSPHFFYLISLDPLPHRNSPFSICSDNGK